MHKANDGNECQDYQIYSDGQPAYHATCYTQVWHDAVRCNTGIRSERQNVCEAQDGVANGTRRYAQQIADVKRV
jgi:hypothetical protein